MGPIKGPYRELARFVRDYLEAHEINVPQLAVLLFPITASRIYDITEGRRAFDGWEVSVFHKRTGILIPARYLRGEDKYGRPKKDRDPNQQKMADLLKEAETNW